MDFVSDVPGAPGTPLPSNIKDTSMTLSWQVPSSDGGSPITHYILEMKSSGVRWTPASEDKIKDTEHTVTKLTKGELYEFRAIAVNKAGPGKPSDSCKAAKAETPISKSTCLFRSCIYEILTGRLCYYQNV